MSALHAVHDPAAGTFTVSEGAVELASYTYRSDVAQRESPRPFLHPLRTRAGHLVTVYRPHDHVWHRGIAWSLPNLGPDNFWGGPTFVRDRGYVQLDNDGSMDTVEVTGASDGATGRAEFSHRLTWTTQGGAAVVDEQRELTFQTLPGEDGAWVLTFANAMTNTSGADIGIGSPTTAGRENAGYGGLFWRGPRSFTDGTVLAPSGPGGDELRGTRAPWMGFTGRHDGVDATSTVLVVDDAGNPRHPPRWFARSEDFAALCPAPFFSAELPFPDGATLGFRYAVLVADGAADPGRAAALAAAGRDVLSSTSSAARR